MKYTEEDRRQIGEFEDEALSARFQVAFVLDLVKKRSVHGTPENQDTLKK